MPQTLSSLTLDDLPIAMALLDGRHVVVESNQAFQALLGADVVGQHLRSLLEAADLQDGEFGKVFRLTVEGDERAFRLSLHGRHGGALMILTDVTERHRLAGDVANG